MQQPELGKKIAELRQEKNLTQEELVEACHVSVRTIQRIEAGEVTPRTSTIKILLSALDVDLEEFKSQTNTKAPTSTSAKRWLYVAWISGIVYLLVGSLEALSELYRASDSIAPFTHNFNPIHSPFIPIHKILYTTIKLVSLVSFSFMLMGFIQLANAFNTYLLKVGSILMISVGVLNFITDSWTLLIPINSTLEMTLISGESIIYGASSVVFGIGLIRLQDGMGRLALAAGAIEIVIGFCFLVVVLFFLGFIFMLPANIIEIVLLYKGYEFLSRESTS